MASNLVVVAIPSQGDSVWQVSSEKAPHLTVLFLGDAMSNPNVNKIVDYVKEQASRLEPFSLLVDHRGFLGEDEADVLFFTKDIPWQLVDFRSTLMYNQEISMAYNAIPQRTDWKPHLTLGYPETPAKPDDWDPMGTQYVSFDKIAVWYGDSEGSEFPLTSNPKPSMSDDVAAWADEVGDILAHHGVKGMKWGVRKAKIKKGAEKVGIFLLDVGWNMHSYSEGSRVQAHNAMADHFNDGLKKINAKPKYQGNLLTRANATKLHDYDKEIEELQHQSWEHAAKKVYGTSPGGKSKGVYNRKTGSIEIRSSGGKKHQQVEKKSLAQAASSDLPDLDFKVRFSSDGHIIQVNKAKLSGAAQSAIEMVLAHHGVKGMKWGVRKSPEKQDAAWQKKNLGISTRKQKRGKFQPKIDKVVIAKANRVYKGKAKEINKRWTRKDRKANKAQYEKEHYDAWTKELKKVTDALPPSPSGKLQFEFRHTPDHWGIYVKDVKHADDHLLFTPVRNADGEIIDVKESAMAQGEDTVSDILAHHGIKGMKWGVRRSKQELAVSDDAATAAAARTKAKEQGHQALSNKEMRDLVTRMQLEQQLKNVTPATRTQKGAKFAANLLVNTGKQQAQMVVNDQVNKQIKKALGG